MEPFRRSTRELFADAFVYRGTRNVGIIKRSLSPSLSSCKKEEKSEHESETAGNFFSITPIPMTKSVFGLSKKKNGDLF